jgi:hypothetical protein
MLFNCSVGLCMDSGIRTPLTRLQTAGCLEPTRRCAASQSTRGKNALACRFCQRQSSAAITRAALDWRVQEDAAVS